MKTFQRVLHWIVALASCMVALHLNPAAAQPGPVQGQIVDDNSRPVPGAVVDLNGRRSRSGDDGRFTLDAPAGDKYILAISHPDFADAVHVSRSLPTRQIWTLVRAQVQTIDPRLASQLTDRRSDLKKSGMKGATFSLGPNSLMDERGRAPSGPVRAAIATLDVGAGEGPGDWAVRSPGGRDGYLVSYGAVFIQFTDASGRSRYQLRPGRSGRLTLPIVPSMQQVASKPTRMDLWYFDTTGALWKPAGVSRLDLQGMAYTGDVKHLSTINTDIAKFSDAACLKVTLDATVPLGSKLRIRYHSGGTAFGQSPTFIMNDTINAAYRVPANTNVLIELLNSADESFGNLVVEDPVGTALVSPVVNTGAAIPPGGNLWPPAPFTSCKPILLRLGLPQVEIRVNERLAAVLSKDNPTDDYLTWAPTYALARLSAPMAGPVTVVMTNDAPDRGGDVVFAAHADPWPVNTTATADTLTLTLPADGSWVPFVIAGRFGRPSTNDKDAIVEAHLGTTAGAIVGTKALMVRVRKNANNLEASERARFLFAWRKFRNQLGSNYVQFQEMHRLASTAGDEAHRQPAFLTWHRAMLLHVERELQKIDPSVALHYWNWDAAAPNIFSAEFMGAPDTSVGEFGVAEPIFAPTNPLNGWNTDLPFSGGELRRSGSDHRLAPVPGTFLPLDHPVDPDLIAALDYGPRSSADSFSFKVERLSHDVAHGWPCAGGHVINPARSAADPLFYLLHSQIDRQWGYWQWKNARHGVATAAALSFPAPAHYDNNGTWDGVGVTTWQKGSFLDDGLWPWDGTTGGTAGSREQRPVNQATGPGTNVPLSTPLVPTSQFPASLRANLWPVAAATPASRHMIDYLGRFRPQDGLGFAYDDVPY